MAAPAHDFTTPSPAFSELVSEEIDAHWDLMPGERIGPPLKRTRARSLLRACVLISVVLGGGWALFTLQSTWPGWWSAVTTTISSAIDRRHPEPATPPPTFRAGSRAPVAEPAARVAALDALPAPTQSPAQPQPSAPSVTVNAPISAAMPPTAAANEPPGPPERPQALDPNQKRAEAVGLHPGLSPVLLARLSEADLRNAGTAIRTAVAETPDDAVLVWPRQRKPDEALFKVRFVPGAAPDCRRYVVTVTKDGWLTTALPMEKCGVQRAQRRKP